MGPNKRVQGTLHKVSGPLTRDVGATMIIEPINPNDPVVGDTAISRPAPSLLGNRWNSQETKMNSPNKALQVTSHKAASNLNADVGTMNETTIHTYDAGASPRMRSPG